MNNPRQAVVVLYEKAPFQITFDRADMNRPFIVNDKRLSVQAFKIAIELQRATEGLAKKRLTSRLMDALKQGCFGLPGTPYERVDAILAGIYEARIRGLIASGMQPAVAAAILRTPSTVATA